MEGRASAALGALLDRGLDLTEDERADWALFMAAQVARGRRSRETIADFSEELAKMALKVAAAQAPDEYFERVSAELVERGEEPLPEITAEARQALIDGESFRLTPSREHLVQTSFAGVEELTGIFNFMTWKLVRFPEPLLVTCDHPVLYWREPSPADGFYGIGPMTAREARIALSPSVALVLVHPFEVDDPEDAEHDGDRELARCLNRDVLRWPSAKQWLVNPEPASQPLPVTPEQWRAQWPRPWMRLGYYR